MWVVHLYHKRSVTDTNDNRSLKFRSGYDGSASLYRAYENDTQKLYSVSGTGRACRLKACCADPVFFAGGDGILGTFEKEFFLLLLCSKKGM